MRAKKTEMVRCMQCGWVGPASQLKPLETLKPKEGTICVCPKCAFPGVEKLTEDSDLSELSEG